MVTAGGLLDFPTNKPVPDRSAIRMPDLLESGRWILVAKILLRLTNTAMTAYVAAVVAVYVPDLRVLEARVDLFDPGPSA